MEKDVKINEKEVVSIGVIPTFKVTFTPLEYVPTLPTLSFYVINISYDSVWFTHMETTKDDFDQ